MDNTLPVLNFELTPLICLDQEIKLKILNIRNTYEVRRWMYNNQLITQEEHLAYIERLKTDEGQRAFVLLDSELEAAGVFNVNDIDLKNKKATWGFYLSDSYIGAGLGAALEFKVIEYCFDVLNLEKMNCGVIEGNTPVMSLHKRFLFQEEGFLRENILKEGKRVGVHLLGLTRSDWNQGSANIKSKYGEVIKRYHIRFHPSLG